MAARPPISAKDIPTEELWNQFKANGDPELKMELVERHQLLVRYVSERICSTLPRSVDVNDLIQDGNFGLMDAIEKFDHSRGIKFKTYCSSRIRGAILDALRSQDWVPRLVRQRAAKLDVIQRSWMSHSGRAPTLGELAKELEVAEPDLDVALKKAAPRAILNVSDRRVPVSEEGESQLESLAEARESDPTEFAVSRDLMAKITRSLTPKETGILEMYYAKGLTLREIGERLHLTESRVCQIHSNVIKRLRERLKPKRDQFQL
ncbi:MAG TPA: FliA/WhiG family RNA polymerase sigma factor [Planctomycetota bacterium]